MAYTLGSKCAKNLCKRIVLLQLIIENVVTCFWNTVLPWQECLYFGRKRARNSKLTRWFAESIMVVMWAVKDRLVSKVMPKSFTEVASGRKKTINIQAWSNRHSTNTWHATNFVNCHLHLPVSAPCNKTTKSYNCKLSMSILVNTSAYIFKSSAKKFCCNIMLSQYFSQFVYKKR